MGLRGMQGSEDVLPPAQSTPRRRPKRVIDSSPTDNIISIAANEDPIAGTRADEAEAEIVIGKSQQTQGAAAAAQSPLFEPSLVSPAESPVIKPVRLLSAQLSDPPSSFRAGASAGQGDEVEGNPSAEGNPKRIVHSSQAADPKSNAP
ncbi:unnamed protein product [Zymoseptoria tritici ST99CH_3D1]|nr:unnamed protein product [Zymoseptoria tritici ST99CH_3D1]